MDGQHRGYAHGSQRCDDVFCGSRDSAKATCGEVGKLSRIILWESALIWSGGFFVVYLAWATAGTHGSLRAKAGTWECPRFPEAIGSHEVSVGAVMKPGFPD
jgi:hypothetical protein